MLNFFESITGESTGSIRWNDTRSTVSEQSQIYMLETVETPMGIVYLHSTADIDTINASKVRIVKDKIFISDIMLWT